jgi:ribulose-5-phosphate 4-epimerase/fuculose-1-phosphate aldolase
MRDFYEKGWCSGTGGGISIRQDNRVIIAPSGVHKERLTEADMYVLDAADPSKVLVDPNAQPRANKLKVSACQPLFYLPF